MSAAGILLFGPHGRCLLCRRSDSGLWSVPAGHLHPGEAPLQGALRELMEETGYGPVANPKLEEFGGYFYLYSGLVPAEFRPILNEEHTEARWVNWRDPPIALHPGMRAVLG